jgi:hypothetical protein
LAAAVPPGRASTRTWLLVGSTYQPATAFGDGRAVASSFALAASRLCPLLATIRGWAPAARILPACRASVVATTIAVASLASQVPA